MLPTCFYCVLVRLGHLPQAIAFVGQAESLSDFLVQPTASCIQATCWYCPLVACFLRRANFLPTAQRSNCSCATCVLRCAVGKKVGIALLIASHTRTHKLSQQLRFLVAQHNAALNVVKGVHPTGARISTCFAQTCC